MSIEPVQRARGETPPLGPIGLSINKNTPLKKIVDFFRNFFKTKGKSLFVAVHTGKETEHWQVVDKRPRSV